MRGNVDVSGVYAELNRARPGPTRGTMILLHQGGWAASGASAVRSLRPVARRFQRMGWRTLNTSYSNGRPGLRDIEAAFRYSDRRWGRDPICAYGESSGGHWALVLATTRPLDCVVAAAAPTLLPAWVDGFARGRERRHWSRVIHSVFGSRRGALELSPVTRWRGRRVPVYLLYAGNDPIVPTSQGRQMERVAPVSELFVLPGGSAPFVHSKVAGPALGRAFRALDRKLRRLG